MSMLSNFFRTSGWAFRDTHSDTTEALKETQSQNVVPVVDQDGAVVVDASGRTMYSVSFDAQFRSERDLIQKYREVAAQPEVDSAINHIVNDAIAFDDDGNVVKLNLDGLKFSDKVKNTIHDEFHTILKLMKFDKLAYEQFRQWYVDGRIAFQVKTSETDSSKGIVDIVPLSPLCIKKVREEKKERDAYGVNHLVDFTEYYVYTNEFVSPATINYLGGSHSDWNSNHMIRFPVDSVVYCTSGVYDEMLGVVKSHLHKAIKPINQVRMIEDMVLIYRMARAPERRVIYVDTGKAPKAKAEQFMQSIMNRFRNKMVYDSSTGGLVDSSKAMSIMEDIYLPRVEGSRGTEITTLSGGENLGKIDDLAPFMRKLYSSLNIPSTRLEANDGFNLGRASEITRDEIIFSKFIDRLRHKFGEIFIELLRRQLILKGLVTQENWNEIRENIKVEFSSDNHFTELKEAEILRERLSILDGISSHIGTFFSKDYVRRQVLRMTDEEIEQMEREIEEDRKKDPNSFQQQPPEISFE